MRELEKVDAVIFGHDKFAYEMVHFVKSSLGKGSDRPSSAKDTASIKNVEDMWETNFVQGLESLLVECAVVNDDIERDCFVSRVYCWFTEKLQERRDLPRKSTFLLFNFLAFCLFLSKLRFIYLLPQDLRVDQLRSSIERMGGDHTHTLRGLDSYQKGIDQAGHDEKMNTTNGQVWTKFHHTVDNHTILTIAL